MNRKLQALAMTLGVMLAGSATALEQGDWLIRVGAHHVDPKSDNHPVVNVDTGTTLTFTVSYFLTESWSLELLAALPFSHDIDLNADGSKVGKTDHLPPTLSAQYHFLPNQKFRPYVGAGVNWTMFFEEKTRGALAGNSLKLDDSFGLAAQAGFDYEINDKWLFNAEVRYIDIDTDAELGGADIGSVEIDPWLVGVSLGFTF